jgi:hypothetical protein
VTIAVVMTAVIGSVPTGVSRPAAIENPAARRRHRVAERRILERAHRRPVDRLDVGQLGEDRWSRRAEDAAFDPHRRQHDRHVERLGRLGQPEGMELDQIRSSLRADRLEQLRLVVDEHQRAVVAGPDSEIPVHRCLPGKIAWATVASDPSG